VVERATRRILCLHTSEGKRHDFKLLKDSRVRMKKETKAVLDSGYQGAKALHANTALPHKKTKKKPLTKEQKKANTEIARERITNEHVIGSVKRFRIAAEKYRNRRRRYHLRLTLLAAIHNLELDSCITAT
jgi:IS5 family transposase